MNQNPTLLMIVEENRAVMSADGIIVRINFAGASKPGVLDRIEKALLRAVPERGITSETR